LRIKEQVGEKGIAVSIQRNVDCLLPKKHQVVKQKPKHFDDISLKERFGRIRVVFCFFFLQNKIYAFLKQGIWTNTIIYMRRLRDRNCTIDSFRLPGHPVTITAEFVNSIAALGEV
jgi:hypothetical protein